MPTPMSRVQLETTLRMSVPTDMLITETWLIPTVAQPDDDQPDDGQRGQEPDGDHDHSDCVVCQFTAQAQSPLCFVDLPALNEFPEAAFIVAEQLFIAAAESAFDSRGPPPTCTC